jgi:hypothetical protein
MESLLAPNGVIKCGSPGDPSNLITLQGAGKNGSEFESLNQDSNSAKMDGFSPTLLRRQDWMDLRDKNRISNRAGVPYRDLPKVVVKELVDDALDASGDVRLGIVSGDPGQFTFFVSNEGPGLAGSNEEIAELYSMSRHLASSKMVRLPTRGMLGNGLRVVAGVVHVADGVLKVSTNGRTLTLRPRGEDGRTVIESVEPWEGEGTYVEVTLRGELARYAKDDRKGGVFAWAQEARALRSGKRYRGKSSAHWYDPAGLWDLLQAAGEVTVEALLEKHVEGCSARAAEVAEDLAGRPCNSIGKAEIEALLKRGRWLTKEVTADRLGKVGRRRDYHGYSRREGQFDAHGAKIPFVVEAWANRATRPGGVICVNRTPICAEVEVGRDEGTNYHIFGGGLGHRFEVGRKDGGEFSILVNVSAPYVPLTSSGKDPDLLEMRDEIIEAIEQAVRVAKRKNPKAGGMSQKKFIRTRLKHAAQKLSGFGTYLFSLRQLFYDLRPQLIELLGREPSYTTFSKVVGAYEDQHGDIEHLYRDDRGSLYHPHSGQTIPLGTRSVAEYQRPTHHYRSMVVSEKEGFFPILIHARWPEQFDCVLCSCKGYATRALRDLIRHLVASGEPITVFVIHDADGPGTVIYENLKRALEPYGIEVVNLGLEPADGRAMGLTVEPVKKKKGQKNRRVPVAGYVPESDKEWLQTNRIELNGMGTEQFIGWVTAGVTAYFRKAKLLPKVLPPAAAVRKRLAADARAAVERRVTEQILREGDYEARVKAECAALKRDIGESARILARDMRNRLQTDPFKHWTDEVKAKADALASPGQK